MTAGTQQAEAHVYLGEFPGWCSCTAWVQSEVEWQAHLTAGPSPFGSPCFGHGHTHCVVGLVEGEAVGCYGFAVSPDTASAVFGGEHGWLVVEWMVEQALRHPWAQVDGIEWTGHAAS